TECLCCHAHRRASCQAVIYKDCCSTSDVHCRTFAAVFAFPSLKLLFFSCHNSFDCLLRNSKRLNDFSVQNGNAASGQGSHGEFLLPRCSELSHYKDVELRFQCSR